MQTEGSNSSKLHPVPLAAMAKSEERRVQRGGHAPLQGPSSPRALATGIPVRHPVSGLLKVGLASSAMLLATAVKAQLIDQTLIPNRANEGVAKSLEEQIGAGRGNVDLVDSSIYIIKRDPARSIRRGRQIFQRKFSVFQGFGPRTNDGVGGPIVGGEAPLFTDASLGAGLADSCAGCHGRPRGSAGFGGNVVTFPDSRDAPHLFGLGLQEMLADEITAEIRAQADAAQAQCEQTGSMTQAFLRGRQGEIPVIGSIDYGRIIFSPAENPHNGVCTANTSEVHGVDTDLRVRPFFARGGRFRSASSWWARSMQKWGWSRRIPTCLRHPRALS